MDTIYAWLKNGKNIDSVSPAQVQLVLHELNVHGIGIQGNKYFTITLEFVATVIKKFNNIWND